MYKQLFVRIWNRLLNPSTWKSIEDFMTSDSANFTRWYKFQLQKKKRGVNSLKSYLSSSSLALKFWISYLSVQICRNFQLLIMSVLRPPLFFPLEMCLQQQEMDQIEKWGVTKASSQLHNPNDLWLLQQGSRGPEPDRQPERSLMFQERSNGMCLCHLSEHLQNAGPGK